MTQLRLRVSMVDADKASALLHHLEDVTVSGHTKYSIEDKTIVADIDERDIPAVKRVLAYHHDWFASSQ